VLAHVLVGEPDPLRRDMHEADVEGIDLQWRVENSKPELAYLAASREGTVAARSLCATVVIAVMNIGTLATTRRFRRLRFSA
jgi:hypothetical protein